MHFISQFSEVINAALDEFFPPDTGVKVIAEPGRYFVESVFTLAAAVFAKRVIDDLDEDSGNVTAIFKKVVWIIVYWFISLCSSLFPICASLDYKKGNSGRKMMYYLKEGVYGSLSCILNDAVEVKPYLHRVNIILLI